MRMLIVQTPKARTNAIVGKATMEVDGNAKVLFEYYPNFSRNLAASLIE